MGLRRTRLLIALLMAAALLSACRPKPSATIVPDAALMPLVPADTTILSGVRIAELKKTAVYQKLLAENKLPQLDEFTQETGIDPRKDIREILFASNGKTTVALVRGQFTEGGIAGSGMEPKLEKRGIRNFAYKGYTLSGDEKVAVAFLNSSVAVAGPTDSVRRVIDERNGSKGGPPKALIEKLEQIPSSNQLWLISTAEFQGAVPPGLSSTLGLKNIPVAVRAAQVTLDVSNGAKLAADVTSSDAASAQKINDALRGAIGMARLTTRDSERDLLQLYDLIQVTKADASVKVSADVPMPLFEKFVNLMQNRQPG